ncbi:uncharacterized protein LOC108683210 [Hyalella azteca]|uniref:Uncharacterized protein LOC108683210 n=1 Tax=Hyalella azteca TaxID=294128 RepID=A0A8B7PS09_HYAAZ|nr:uncharacterized protein LOC108683210 [Hyalella azteca]
MEDCVMAWLLLIAQRAKQQLDKDIKRINARHKHEDNQDNRDDNNLRELVNDMVDFVKLVVEKTERLVWSGGACPPEMLRFLGSQLTYHLNSFWQSLYSDYCRGPAPPNTISRWACLVMSALCDLKEELSSALLRLDPSRTAMQEAHHVLSLMPYKAARKMCYEEEEFLQLAAVLEALQQFFTSSILLEESLLQAEERWKEQLSLARERGLPLAELQHRYYSQRYQEQQLQLLEDQTSATMLLVNIVFVEGSGLFVSIVQSPSAACLAKAALKSISSTANNNNIGDTSEDTGRSLRPPPAQKASNILSSMFKGVTSAGGVYVKAQLVPAEWFPDAPLDLQLWVSD